MFPRRSVKLTKNENGKSWRRFALPALVCVGAAGSFATPVPGQTRERKIEKRLEITRAVRPWEFLVAVGKRAAVFGNESGRIEAWTYPLKLFRDFHVVFHTEGRAIPAEELVRTIEARPESTTLVYEFV